MGLHNTAAAISETGNVSYCGESGDKLRSTDNAGSSLTVLADEVPVPKLPSKPHQPKIKYPKKGFGKQQRSFSSSWYEKHPWLHYVPENDSVLCYYCMRCVELKMPISGHVDDFFTQTGFSNWQKALDKFRKHETSDCHINAVYMVSKAATASSGIDEILSTSLAKEKASNRAALLVILSTIRFLARQGLPLRGNYIGGGEVNSNFMQLLCFLSNYIPNLSNWLNRAQDKFTSPPIQNEILQIMALTILRNVADDIRKNKYFSIMVDETTDISNKEQLVFCLRHVDENFEAHEDLIGMYSLDSTTSEYIEKVILDVLLRLSLPLSDCRGQCYDGASAMAGCRTGVATRISAKEPRAVYTHCYGHALNLAVQDLVKKNHILWDALDTVQEITKLIKKSPKRETLFEKVKDDIAVESPGIHMFAPTRWTVRASALQSISENYIALKETWLIAKQSTSDSEMRARIGGVAKQMESFNFFFWY